MSNLQLIQPKRVQSIIDKFCFMIGMIPSSYKMSLTYEEQILSIGKYLEETVYPAINNNAEAVAQLQELFIDLKDYVENYFNNLDVQEEINNKLDSMLEDGSLQNILLNYVNITKIYNTTIEMLQDSSLSKNQKIKTLGYFNLNDGGGADFFITDSISNNFQLNTINNLYAEMIIKNDCVDFRQLGAKINDNTQDCKNILLSYVDLCNNLGKTLQLLIPEGKFYFSPTHICRIGGVNIQGSSGFPGRGYTGTVFLPFQNYQNYIIKFRWS